MEFDLKKYLAQTAHMSPDEIKDVVINSTDVGNGLSEYINGVHSDGAHVIEHYVTDDELDHLLALVAGISTSKMMETPEISKEDKILLLAIMTGNSEFMKALTLSVMCASIGIAGREEWR